eukprot:353000-Chlamydomonas_euryale.AAC.9
MQGIEAIAYLKQRVTGNELDQNAADAPHVARIRPALAEDDFRCAVVARAHNVAVVLVFKCCAPKVNHLDCRAAWHRRCAHTRRPTHAFQRNQQNVLWFQKKTELWTISRLPINMVAVRSLTPSGSNDIFQAAYARVFRTSSCTCTHTCKWVVTGHATAMRQEIIRAYRLETQPLYSSQSQFAPQPQSSPAIRHADHKQEGCFREQCHHVHRQSVNRYSAASRHQPHVKAPTLCLRSQHSSTLPNVPGAMHEHGSVMGNEATCNPGKKRFCICSPSPILLRILSAHRQPIAKSKTDAASVLREW